MSQSLSQKFTPWSLLRFAAPSMIMMVFLSLYTIVDGMFISRLVGSNALSSANIVYPTFSLLLGVGIMLATGGSAVVARKLGEGDVDGARSTLTMLAVASVLFSLLFLAIVIPLAEPISRLLGSNDLLLEDCITYLVVLAIFAPACMLQVLYQSMIVTAGRPGFGLALTVVAGLINALFDYIFMAHFHLGIAGAALATGSGQLFSAIAGTIFFLNRKRELYYQKFHFNRKELLLSCFNGSSEMVSNMSNAIVSVAFNLIMMHLVGPDGVAAITIILYGQFLLSSLFMGFGMGVAPIFGFRLGAGKFQELHHLFRICMKFLIISSVGVTLLSWFGSDLVVSAFVSPGSGPWVLAARGFRLFGLGYLFCGINIFASGFFTAVSDGKHSALISVLRSLVFILVALAALPFFFDLDGVWLSIPAAELMTILFSIYLLQKHMPGKQ